MACGKCKGIFTKLSLNKSTYNLIFSSQSRASVFGATYSRHHSTLETDTPDVSKKEKISKAMKAYLDRAMKHDEFLKQEAAEYKIGKRHLANIMGEDPETFSQEDVNKAIAYLLPSGLYDPKARPVMKPPDEIFPKRKAAEFDETGRPHHFLFYTTRPNFNQLLRDCVEQLDKLNDFQDKMLRKHLQPDAEKALELPGSNWISMSQLEARVLEPLVEIEYDKFISVMTRLLEHPYAYRIEEFIRSFRKQLIQQSQEQMIPQPQTQPDGRLAVTETEGRRKSAGGYVTVTYPGTGVININSQGIEFFQGVQQREQVLFPLIFTEMLNKVDVTAHIESGGPSGQAGVVRYGIAMGLRPFISQDMVEKMSVAGLLHRDPRTKERKKPGQAGARKKYTWKKR